MIAVALHYEYRLFLKHYQHHEYMKHYRSSFNLEHAIDDYEYLQKFDDQSFLIVNRNREYLKRSAYEFAKEYNIELDDGVEFASSSDFNRTNANTSIKKRQFQKKPSFVRWPLKRSQYWLSSYFGPRKKADGSNSFHYGLDMAAAKGTPVKAAGLGVVIEAAYTKGYGNTIVIAHADKFYQTRYAHLDSISVKKGQRVVSGQKIGSVGNTGSVRGENGGKNAYHLHFEVKLHGKHIDPLRVLPT